MPTILAKKIFEGAFFSSLLLFPWAMFAAEAMSVPANIQVPLILKILTFDRNFSSRIKSKLTIGLVYNPEDSASLKAEGEISNTLNKFTEKTIRKLPIQYISLAYTTENEVANEVKSNHINIFYILPGNADNLKALVKISRMHQITTVTGVPDYVSKGVTVGIGLKSNNKPRILINLPSSKSEGSAFDANLLRLATVLK